MTTSTIKKAAAQNGIDMTLINVIRVYAGKYRFEMADAPPELINKYNKEVKRLLKVLGLKFWGFKTGTGAWEYETGDMSASAKLAFANID